MRVLDCFPFSGFGAELDLLEIRLHEMAEVAHLFVIVESERTIYGDKEKPYYLEEHWKRFKDFHGRILYCKVDRLSPDLPATLQDDVPDVSMQDIRTAGRCREAYQRNVLLPYLKDRLIMEPEDVIVFSDLDEIPNARTVEQALPFLARSGIHRLKQRTFYYNVNTLIDYGRDVCSRARVGTFGQLEACGGFQAFRMHRSKDEHCPAMENGGWHMSFFGDLGDIRQKVAINSPGLREYEYLGLPQLATDIIEGKDLLHRPPGFSELPETFQIVDDSDLPKYYLQNKNKFRHFTRGYHQRTAGPLTREN